MRYGAIRLPRVQKRSHKAMTTPRKPAHTAAMRKAFELRFGNLDRQASGLTLIKWDLFKAGAAWQRRQKDRK